MGGKIPYPPPGFVHIRGGNARPSWFLDSVCALRESKERGNRCCLGWVFFFPYGMALGCFEDTRRV